MTVALSELKPAWPVTELRNVLSEPPSYGINAPGVPHDGILPTYIRITDISADGRFKPNPAVAVDDQTAEKYVVAPGDILVARTGASVGKSYLHKAANGELVYAGFLLRLRCDPEVMDPRFLAAFMRTHGYWTWVGRESARSGQPGLNANQFADLNVPCPSILEQQAIAEALSDVDDLIESLEQLIDKKKMMIRVGAAQCLLSGQRRLPGHAGDWIRCRLGDMGTFSKGGGISKSDLTPDGLACILYGEIYTNHNNWIRSFHSRIPPEVATRAEPLRPGDLLFTGSGETAEDIGKCVVYLGTEDKAFAGGDIVILRDAQADPKFLGYALNSATAARQKTRLAQGATVVHLNARQIAQVEVSLPSVIDEQRAIAEVLSDMDAEIDALVARRAKTVKVKQAMMHKLLTGKTRLV